MSRNNSSLLMGPGIIIRVWLWRNDWWAGESRWSISVDRTTKEMRRLCTCLEVVMESFSSANGKRNWKRNRWKCHARNAPDFYWIWIVSLLFFHILFVLRFHFSRVIGEKNIQVGSMFSSIRVLLFFFALSSKGHKLVLFFLALFSSTGRSSCDG